MRFALSNNERIEPSKGAKGLCPCCGSELVAKCGEIKVHHWSHKKKCDDHWWENETEWHRNWKNKFPKEWQEIIQRDESGEKHIADVKTGSGWSIEFQHSPISKEERDSLQELPLELNFTPDSHNEGLATYFRTYVKKQMQEWVRNNPKPNGEKYNIYRDGLRIYTTIDARLQALGEEAVNAHMKKLQAEFFKQNTPELNPTAPFLELREGQIDTLLERSARRSERWRAMRASGKDEATIWESFKKPTAMSVFSWKGDIDTVMTPLDSMRYYKHYLRSAMMSMDPSNGHVKAWVGGYNYTHFQYDQVKQGRRQIGR